MTQRIVSISSSRADVGILTPVWKALSHYDVDLHIVATGMHRAPGAHPFALDGIKAGVHELGEDLGGHGNAAAVGAISAITAACGQLYQEIEPDLILVIGDRLDMLPAAVAALPFNTPVAHLHGGEVTEGAIDDRIRHALTQLAHLHLVSCKSAEQRVRQMRGAHVPLHITGAPGLDTLVDAPVIERGRFMHETGLAEIAGLDDPFILATVHPETNAGDPQAPMRAVLAALEALGFPVLFTAPNSDPGGATMHATLDRWVADHPFAIMVDTLGSRLYPNALRQASAMVGNSSSGIVEAGLFGLPVVDVGDRQKGRERGKNVVSVQNDTDAVCGAVFDALHGARFPNESPYGSGRSGPVIAQYLVEFEHFVDSR